MDEMMFDVSGAESTEKKTKTYLKHQTCPRNDWSLHNSVKLSFEPNSKVTHNLTMNKFHSPINWVYWLGKT